MTWSPDAVVEAPRIDERPRARRLRGPLGAAFGVAAAAALVFVVDPNRPGVYPTCPTQVLFGVDCPACGALRGTHALLHGDLAGSLDHNVVLPIAVVAMVVFGARWFVRAWRGEVPAVTRRQFRRRNGLLLLSLSALLVFGVVRNFVPYLSSGA